MPSTLPDHPPAGHSSCTLRPPPPGRAFLSPEPSSLTSLAPTSPAQGSCGASCALSAPGKRPEESSAPGSPSLAPQPGHGPWCGVAPGLGRAEGEGLAVRSLAQPAGRRAGMGLGLCGPPRRGPPGWPQGQGPPGWPQDKATRRLGPRAGAPRLALGQGPPGGQPLGRGHQETGPRMGPIWRLAPRVGSPRAAPAACPCPLHIAKAWLPPQRHPPDEEREMEASRGPGQAAPGLHTPLRWLSLPRASCQRQSWRGFPRRGRRQACGAGEDSWAGPGGPDLDVL